MMGAMRISAILIALLLFAPPPGAAAGEPEGHAFSEDEEKVIREALEIEEDLVRLVEDVRGASVSIESWRGGRKVSGGSGVFISRRGFLLTNQHVVQGAEEIWLALEDHRRLRAEVVGRDARGDIALLKAEGRRISSANPHRARPDRLSPGEWVIATGNPFFLASDGEAIVTLGVISGLGRVLGGRFVYGDAIQHDAEINPGNSGGPLWDSFGRLLGINGRIASTGSGSAAGYASSQGVGFTIPIDQVRNFFEAMMEGRQALHGDEILGIEVETETDEQGEPMGVRVKKVRPDSPAARARRPVKVGDVIWRITLEGKYTDIGTFTDFMRLMSPLAEGSRVTLHVLRGRHRYVLPRIPLEPSRRKGRR